MSAPRLLVEVVAWLAGINLLLAVFNALPAAPLDGGRLLRAFLWWRTGDRLRATAGAAAAGRVLGWLLVALGVVVFMRGGGFGGLWLALIGWFLIAAATAEGRQAQLRAVLAGVPVRDAMTRDPLTVPATLTIADLPEEARKALDRPLEQHGRYQSLYVVDGAGEILVRVGEEPRAPKKVRIRPGVVQTNTSGKEPVLAAVAAQPAEGAPERSGRRYVVGEFKVQYLTGILSRPGLGSVWLVDSAHRVIASNKGFVAFGHVSDGRLRAQLKAARTTKGSAELLLGWRNPAVAAVAPFNDKLGVASALGWKVASIRPVFWIGLPEYEAQRRIMLVGLLGLTTGALCLGWLHLVVVRPLREIAQGAEALAAGDRRTVLYPRYDDEVGSVARGLELIRQRLPRTDAPPAPGSPDGAPTPSTSPSGPGPWS